MNFFPSQSIKLPHIGKVERINHHYALLRKAHEYLGKTDVSIVIDEFEINKPCEVF